MKPLLGELNYLLMAKGLQRHIPLPQRHQPSIGWVLAGVLGLMLANPVRADLSGDAGAPAGLVFADAVVDYVPGSPAPAEAYQTAANALGAPDYGGNPSCPDAGACTFVSLGSGGSLTLRFTNAAPSGGGSEAYDLWVFEVGPAVETTSVEVSQDGIEWVSVGDVSGNRRGVDLDAYGLGPDQSFAFVRLTDDPAQGDVTGPTPGADIDAVGAVAPVPPGPDNGPGAFRSQLIAWAQYVSPFAPAPPGNSIEAIDYAFELGYDGVEMDLQLTKDSVPILMHNGTIDETTSGAGLAADYTFAELQQFVLGWPWRGQQPRIPSLEEALRQCGTNGFFLGDMRISATGAGPVRDAVVRSGFDTRRLWFSTYDLATGQILKSLLPGARIVVKQYAYPQDVSRNWIDAVAAAGADGVMLQLPKNCGPIQDFVNYLHWKGLKLCLFVNYTSGTLAELQSAVDAGTDYILTVHYDFRNLVRWPDHTHDAPPRLVQYFDPAQQMLSLSWQPQAAYAYRLETSADLVNWNCVQAPFDSTEAPARMGCQLPMAASGAYFRLRYVR